VNPPAEVAPWIERLARVGYAAKAVLYATIGILAAPAALGDGERTTDTGGALRELLRAPYGRTMLIVVAVGLLGYSLWLFVRAATDAEHCGDGSARRPRWAAGRWRRWDSGWWPTAYTSW
jgi:hypothetical protein